jgi:GNAT superfamily N-acetyltransferase
MPDASTHAVVVRRATADDFDAVATISEEGDALHREHVAWLFQTPEGSDLRRRLFNQQLASLDAALFIAEAGTPVGVACVVLRDAPELETFIQQRWAVLDYVVVTSAWRGRGVGTALARAAEAWASDREVKWIELGVYEFNDGARRLYETLGYVPVSTRMRKRLSQGE